MTERNDLDQLSINTLRFLAVDEVEKANSGHPGAPLGESPIVYLLFHRIMRHNPKHSKWSNRDRFVLSDGHASAMLYGALHLSGYKVSMDDLKQFRQWQSITPGHPEYGLADGVEVTTGPLGQGFAMAVGMAMAEKHLAAMYNRPGLNLVDHHTYVLCGDGDMMEGVSHEAASLAGKLHLGKMIVFYDDNSVSLDGPTDLSFSDDVPKRFEGYHWHVQRVEDGNDLAALEKAVEAARQVTDRPSLIAVRTIIGYGSPKAGSYKSHGSALGEEAVKATKKNLGWPDDKTFYVPEEAAKNWLSSVDRGARQEQDWNRLLTEYRKAYPAEAAEFERTQAGELKKGWRESLPVFASDAKPVATRSAGYAVMNGFVKSVPELFGGAADLSVSTKTEIKGAEKFHVDPAGVNVYYGVREFGMCAMVNGMAVHGGLIPYGSTFFVFTDYAKPAIRLAALMQSRSIFVFTHDSVGLGEDGPTHQPIEHLMALRAVPFLTDLRPADANETSACWALALERKTPSFFALSRQNLPILDAKKYGVFDGVRRGAYIVEPGGGSPDVLLIATGSELWPTLAAASALKKESINARVVSMPSWKLFEEQTDEYKASIFPVGLPKLAVEAGATLGWWKYVGREGDVIGIDRFGASAPGAKVLEEYGFNPANIAARAKALVARSREAQPAAAGR